jgi:hypothetical protein
MAKPLKKKPFKDAIEEIMVSYGAKDWVVAARGDNIKILSGELEFQAKFWAAGTGNSEKKEIDDICTSLLIADLEFLKSAMLAFMFPN